MRGRHRLALVGMRYHTEELLCLHQSSGSVAFGGGLKGKYDSFEGSFLVSLQ